MPSRPSGGGRLVRLESQVQRVLAELVAREVKDPRVGPLTITQVKLAPDLSIARVYYVPFGGGAGADIEEGLAAAAGFLRGEVGRRAGLRHAPKLEFIFDDSFDRAERLNALIDSANRPRES
ncbi:MAG: 30S ribosome-binding factor RbfA [Pseudomonadota bacterium]|jgi:ribosome-binding factor A|nr:MAG: 30S ribosome-binding factor RbfA [Pseudomonadota bacterium]